MSGHKNLLLDPRGHRRSAPRCDTIVRHHRPSGLGLLAVGVLNLTLPKVGLTMFFRKIADNFRVESDDAGGVI